MKMCSHSICEYIPIGVGVGEKTNLTVQKNTTTLVPPKNGKNYAKCPKSKVRSVERLRDAYFLGQLLALYQGREFVRGNLDAGRLNRLWCDDVLLIIDGEQPSSSVNARYRIDLINAQHLLHQISN